MIDWPSALADALLPRGRSGRPALLSCTDITLASAAADTETADDPIRGLVDVVRAGGGLPGAVHAASGWQQQRRPRRAPPHLPALALLVLAASRMGVNESSANAYYERLADLIGAADRTGHPPYEGFAQLAADGFGYLAEWMADDESGERGYLHRVDPPSVRRHVGVPVGHAVLRAADVRWLGTFFFERRGHLDAGWDPAGTLLHHPARHQITGPAREMLDDPARRPLLSAALQTVRTAWDGSRSDPDGRQVVAGSLTAQLDLLTGVLYLTLRADELTADEDGTDPSGAPVRIPVPPATLNVPVAWLTHAADGPARVLLEGRRSLHVVPGPLVMFVVGDGGLEEVPVATEPVWALTCRDDIEGGDVVDIGLPDGWRMLANVPLEALPDDHRTSDPSRDAPEALSIVGGLALGDGGWLAERAPTIAGPADLDAPLLLNGRPFDHLQSGRTLRLRALDGQPGVFQLRADGERLDLHLVDAGPRVGHGALGWRLDDPSRSAQGPGEVTSRVGTLRGAVIDDGENPGPPAFGPWTRATGAIWALRSDGAMQVVAAPNADGWLRHVGWQPGAAWPLPEDTVWACQPGSRWVTLVDAGAGPVAATDDAAQCVVYFEHANVLDAAGAGNAEVRWRELCEACREAQLV